MSLAWENRFFCEDPQPEQCRVPAHTRTRTHTHTHTHARARAWACIHPYSRKSECSVRDVETKSLLLLLDVSLLYPSLTPNSPTWVVDPLMFAYSLYYLGMEIMYTKPLAQCEPRVGFPQRQPSLYRVEMCCEYNHSSKIYGGKPCTWETYSLWNPQGHKWESCSLELGFRQRFFSKIPKFI